MGILNYRIDKIDGSVDKRGTEKVDVKEAFSIVEVNKKNDKMANVKWGFDVDYGAVGKLSLEGTLDYVGQKIDEDTVEKTIKGKKKLVLQGNALKEVSNFILRRGIVEAIVVTRTLQLPAPIQLPSVNVEKKKA
jgi:hypothetical protein